MKPCLDILWATIVPPRFCFLQAGLCPSFLLGAFPRSRYIGNNFDEILGKNKPDCGGRAPGTRVVSTLGTRVRSTCWSQLRRQSPRNPCGFHPGDPCAFDLLVPPWDVKQHRNLCVCVLLLILYQVVGLVMLCYIRPRATCMTSAIGGNGSLATAVSSTRPRSWPSNGCTAASSLTPPLPMPRGPGVVDDLRPAIRTMAARGLGGASELVPSHILTGQAPSMTCPTTRGQWPV